MHEFYLEAPEFYVVDPDFNTEVELHIADLKKGDVPKKNRKTSTLILLTTTSETQNDLNDEPEPKVPSFKSLQAISKSLIESVRSLTVLPEKSNSIYYKTPKYYMRKKGSQSQPKIRVIKPKERTSSLVESLNVTVPKSTSLVNSKLLNVPVDFEDKFSVSLNPDNTENRPEGGISLNIPGASKPGKALLIPKFSPNPSPVHKKHCRSIQSLSPTVSAGEGFPNKPYNF